MFFNLPELSPGQMALLLVILAAPILPNLWSLWHAFYREFESVNEKVFWIMLATLLPAIGGIVYIVFGRPRSRKMGAPGKESR